MWELGVSWKKVSDTVDLSSKMLFKKKLLILSNSLLFLIQNISRFHRSLSMLREKKELKKVFNEIDADRMKICLY